MNKPNLYERIHSVMTEIETIKKTGRNEFHKYDYATEADFVHALRPLFKKNGLVVIPRLVGDIRYDVQQTDKGPNYLTTIQMEFTLVNIHNPEERCSSIVGGQGQDKGDKGIYKAITGAKKYWAALNFFVATGDDPEKDDQPSNRKPVFKKSKSTEVVEDF